MCLEGWRLLDDVADDFRGHCEGDGNIQMFDSCCNLWVEEDWFCSVDTIRPPKKDTKVVNAALDDAELVFCRLKPSVLEALLVQILDCL